MAKIEDTNVKKQIQTKPSTSAATKPKVETSNKDVKVFGNLSTANKTSDKTVSSETLAQRLSGAQGEKTQTQSKEVKRDDAQVSVSAFGSLTGINSTSKTSQSESIFNRLDNAQKSQATTNPINANDVVSTEKALAQESTSTGSKFDSENFAAFNDNAPMTEAASSAMVEKSEVSTQSECMQPRGGYMPPQGGCRPAPRVQRNEIMALVGRQQTGHLKSQHLSQIDADWRAAMGMELNTGGCGSGGYGGGSVGSGCGCGSTGSTDTGCSDSSSSSSKKHHHKKRGVSAGQAVAIGIGAGLGGLALGGLAGWGLTKMFSSNAEAAKGASGTAVASASAGGAGSAASGVGSAAGSAAQGAGTLAKAANVEKEASTIQGISIPANHDISGTLNDNKSVISDLKSAKANGRINEALQAGEAQYAADSQAIETVNGDISSTGTAIAQNQSNQEAATEIGETASDASKTLDSSITEDSARKEQCLSVEKQYRGKAHEYYENAKKAENDVSSLGESIASLEADLKAKKAEVNNSGGDTSKLQSLNSQISTLESKIEEKKQEKTKREQDKANFESMQKDAISQADEAKTTAENVSEKIQTAQGEKTRYDALKDNMQTRITECTSNKEQLSKAEGLLQKNLTEAQTNKDNLVTARNDLLKEMNNTFRDGGGSSGFLGLFGGDNYSMKSANAFKTIDSPTVQTTNSTAINSLLNNTSASTLNSIAPVSTGASTANAVSGATAANVVSGATAAAENTGTGKSSDGVVSKSATPNTGATPQAESTTNNNDVIKDADGNVLNYSHGGALETADGEPYTGLASDNIYYEDGHPKDGVAENGINYDSGTPAAGIVDDVHYGDDGKMIQNSFDEKNSIYCGNDGKPGAGEYQGVTYGDDGKPLTGYSEEGVTGWYKEGIGVEESQIIDEIVNKAKELKTTPGGSVLNDYRLVSDAANNSEYSKDKSFDKWLEQNRTAIEQQLNS